jgi:hypothetical protein
MFTDEERRQRALIFLKILRRADALQEWVREHPGFTAEEYAEASHAIDDEIYISPEEHILRMRDE